MADYNFGNVILGAISDTMSRNEQQRQFNVNDQWRNFALQKELEEAERQRVFTARESGLGREHNLEYQGRGFRQQREMFGLESEFAREQAATGFALNPMTLQWEYKDARKGLGKGFFPLNVLPAAREYGVIPPDFTRGRADITERALYQEGPENLLMRATLNPFLPGAAVLPQNIYRGIGNVFNLSESRDQARALRHRQRQYEAAVAKNPMYPLLRQWGQRSVLPGSGGMLNFSQGY